VPPPKAGYERLRRLDLRLAQSSSFAAGHVLITREAGIPARRAWAIAYSA
jgi:hypothetical protein